MKPETLWNKNAGAMAITSISLSSNKNPPSFLQPPLYHLLHLAGQGVEDLRPGFGPPERIFNY
jgi:hypothetical protein